MRLLKMAARRIAEGTLLILDISDLSKKYARRMEYMAKVSDGSEKGEGRGYWTLNVIGAEIGSARVVPLYGRLYSPQAPDWASENAEITRAIAEVSATTEGRCLWNTWPRKSRLKKGPCVWRSDTGKSGFPDGGRF